MNKIIKFSFSLVLCLILILCRGSTGTTFTLINKCDFTVWPGILANAGGSGLGSTGFELPSGGSRSFQAAPGWSGRVWARTHCNFDSNSGQGTCATGDCGSGQVECKGSGAIPPSTLAEFTIGSSSYSPDYYDVSLVDGYNLPIVVEPSGGSGSCISTGCPVNLNQHCPTELQVGEGNACKSACEAFARPEYCCSGAYGSPDTCKASVYSQMFKSWCPRAYSFAYDDSTSTFTCAGADYTITFCPAMTSQKSSRDTQPSPANPETTSGSASASTSGSGSGSGSGSNDGPTLIIGGGQFLDISSTVHSLRTSSNSFWELTLITSTILLFHFLCL